ncbi:MAG: hypothetical protein WEB03_10855 [Nitriliruptor sp.]|uniref:hypothetical protein n=1 Tax=Nitriliruptor sp. TaxID=2448056 RepID=UPI00349FED82
MNDTDTTVLTRRPETDHPSITWLEDEFPGWEVSIGATSGWGREELRTLWVARQPGHHPQAELSAAKLHTRLTDYLAREARRRGLAS